MAEIPVIIGVGDVKNRNVNNAKEPVTLMIEAIEIALKDASSSSASDLKSEIDSIDVVKTWTWPYPDLPSLLSEKLGVQDSVKWKHYSEHGGNQPGKLFDEAAKRIARGECKVAAITGGEALASRASPQHQYQHSYAPANTPSLRLRSSKKAPSTRLDNAIHSRRHRLHAHRPRSRKQYDLNPLAATIHSLPHRPRRHSQNRRTHTRLPAV